MISFSDQAILNLIVSFIYPLTRILGVIMSTPIFNHPAIPIRVKLGFGFVLTMVIAPTITNMPHIDIFSLPGLLILIEQFVIGLTMGFSMRIVFAAVEMAGQLIGTTMGLGFATFYDPHSQGQSMAISQFLVVLTMLIFFSLDGHLLVISAMAESFVTMPMTIEGSSIRPMTIAMWGADVFNAGLLMSLPAVAALLLTNMAMGVLSKTAPQLNLFGIGFPITITMGFVVLALSLTSMLQPIEHLIQRGMTHMHQMTGAPNSY